MLKVTPRRSRILDKMRAGKTALCYKTNLACARATEIAAICGFDCVWTCQEHVPNDYDVLEKQILAAKAHDVDMMVRVQKGSYNDYIIPLELDAAAIMVPHLMSAEEARKTVKMTKFRPIGLRPIDGGNADGLYCLLDAFEYNKFANENRCLICQIEDVEPMDELEEIAATPGLDMLFFGPADFSHSMDDVYNFSNPKLLEARKKVLEAAHRHGKFFGTTCGLGSLKELMDMGADFLSCGADVCAIGDNCTKIIETYQEIIGNK